MPSDDRRSGALKARIGLRGILIQAMRQRQYDAAQSALDEAMRSPDGLDIADHIKVFTRVMRRFKKHQANPLFNLEARFRKIDSEAVNELSVGDFTRKISSEKTLAVTSRGINLTFCRNVAYLSGVGLVNFYPNFAVPIPDSLSGVEPFYFGGNLRRPENPGNLETAFVLPVRKGRNYYHTLIQLCLCLMVVTKYAPDWPVIFPDALKSVVTQIAARLGLPACNILIGPPDLAIKHCVLIRGVEGPLLLREFRDILTADVNRDGARRRIYLSRRDSAKRKLVNEEEVERALRSLGFDIMVATGMSLDDQIETFANAEAVVSPHGAGLANLVFAPFGTKVLELMPPSYRNDLFQKLAKEMGHDASYVVGEHFGQADLSNWRINPELVRRSLGELSGLPQVQA